MCIAAVQRVALVRDPGAVVQCDLLIAKRKPKGFTSRWLFVTTRCQRTRNLPVDDRELIRSHHHLTML